MKWNEAGDPDVNCRQGCYARREYKREGGKGGKEMSPWMAIERARINTVRKYVVLGAQLQRA